VRTILRIAKVAQRFVSAMRVVSAESRRTPSDAIALAEGPAGERPRRRLARILFEEPSWLCGVTWPLLAMVLLIASLQNASRLSLALFLRGPERGHSWASVPVDLAIQLAVGVTIVVVVSALRSVTRPRIPLPLVLALGVVIGTFLPVNVLMYPLDSEYAPALVNMVAQRVMVPWAIAAVAWYFLQRANLRAAALDAAATSQRRLEATMLEARLQALHAQVEPHFLFNTLAHVRLLYRTDPLRARLMLDSFRAYLRAALPQMRESAATLGGEVDVARAYLDVQQVRMGSRLAVTLDVPAALRAHAFPSMMLLSLVENAVKHGLNTMVAGGCIAIAAAEHDGVLQVSVADTGRGIGEQIGSGVGLANIRSRLAARHGAEASLTLTPNTPHGVRALIRVPVTVTPSDVPRHAEGATQGV
jgi:signal transduction histidine kinase